MHKGMPVWAGNLMFVMLALGVYAVVYECCGGCPFYRITGISCPACGTVGALRALLNGNFHGYLDSNPWALPYLLVFGYICLEEITGRKCFEGEACCIVLVCIVFFLWVIRLINN